MSPYAVYLADAFLAVSILILTVLVGTVTAACVAEFFNRLKP